jgi:hypothetical protein
VKEHPTLFNGPMVRALLAGTKTQTRRVVTARNSLVDGEAGFPWGELDFTDAFVDAGPSPAGNPGPYLKVARPSYETRHRIYSRVQPGDRLWVRETFYCDHAFARKAGSAEEVSEWLEMTYYGADYLTQRDWANADEWAEGVPPWRPSIHMPRWASRITLEVTDVRVERLQEISEDDARAEGVEANPYVMADGSIDEAMSITASVNFAALWDSINGWLSWQTNPWVWVVSFKRVML